MIEVQLLGPPRVLRDGTLVRVDTRKATALLAYLALTDQPRSREALADLLWPDADLERARGALRRTLSSLRSAVGPDHLEATRDHVRLIKGPGLSIDVDRFRALRADGDLTGAVAVFGGRLLEGLWLRDAPQFEEWQEVQTEALNRQLTSTLALLAAEQESAGDVGAAIATARRWLAADPLHESAHQALIRLHGAAGDRASATAQYDECVRVLSEELGVAPLSETTQLYEAVNRGELSPVDSEPTLSPARAAAATEVPMVGRDAQLRTMLAAHTRAVSVGQVVLVEGEAGIGKTRVIHELVDSLRGQDAVVLAGRCYQDEGGLAFGPVIDMLRERLGESDTWLGALEYRRMSEAARLLPELADRRPVTMAPLDEPGAESRFLAAVWDTLAAAAAGPVPGVVVLDDAHWADEATLRLLAHGLRRLAGRSLLVVIGWRTPHDHPIRRTVAAAQQADRGVVVSLGRLSEDQVDAVARSLRPENVDGPAARRLWATTEGVPLLVVEYLRAAQRGADPAVVPPGVQDLLQDRLDPVSETGRQVLAAAAVIGRTFAADTARSVSGRTDDETVSAIEESVRLGLIRQRTEDYDFEHDLLRSFIYEDIGLARRRLLHGRAADRFRTPAATHARHLQQAGRNAAAALAYRQAGDEARSVFANREALAHFRTALDLGHPERAALLASIADVLVVLGDYAAAVQILHEAASIAAPEQSAALEHRLGRIHHRRADFRAARTHFEAALDAASHEDVDLRARITADLSLALQADGDPGARALAEEAARLARDASSTAALCQADNLLGIIAVSEHRVDDALEVLAQARSLAEELGDGELHVAALNNMALAHRAQGQLSEAMLLTTTALKLCRERGDRHREAALHNNLADLHRAAGHEDDAMTHLKSAVQIFAEVGSEDEPQPGIWKLVRW